MRYLLILALFCCATAVNAQKVKFSAVCDVNEVKVNTPFKVSFVLENAEVKKPEFPKFIESGFRVISGPTAVPEKEAYVFLLAPKRTGKLTIGPAKVITSRGKVLSSNSITINSVADNVSNSEEENDNLPSEISGKVLFRLIPSTKTAVPGELVTIDLKAYSMLALENNLRIIENPSSKDAIIKPTKYSDGSTSPDVFNGRPYESKVIARYSFIAGSSGSVEISPSKIAFQPIYYSSRFSGNELYVVNTNSLNIEVKPLKDVPATFNGAVGKYEMFAYIEKTSISSDDLLNLALTVSGVGELKKISSISIKFGKKGEKPFDVYPPKIVESISNGKGVKSGIIDFIYRLEPNAIGDFELRPTFTYFDTELRRFVTVDTIIPVRVIQGKKVLGKSVPLEAESDENKIKLSFGDAAAKAYWTKPGAAFFGSLLFWILFFLPVAIFIMLAAGKVYLKKRYEAILRQRVLTKANRELNENLKNALKHLSASDAPAFYHSISEAFKNFLGKKLKIPKAEMSKEIMAEKLEGLVEDDKIRSLSRIMKICELSVFAGQDNKQAMQLVYDDSRELFAIFTKIFS
jgi:hypothetical protein